MNSTVTQYRLIMYNLFSHIFSWDIFSQILWRWMLSWTIRDWGQTQINNKWVQVFFKNTPSVFCTFSYISQTIREWGWTLFLLRSNRITSLLVWCLRNKMIIFFVQFIQTYLEALGAPGNRLNFRPMRVYKLVDEYIWLHVCLPLTCWLSWTQWAECAGNCLHNRISIVSCNWPWQTLFTMSWKASPLFINNDLLTHLTVASLPWVSYRAAPVHCDFLTWVWFHRPNWRSWIGWVRIQIQWAVFVHCLVLHCSRLLGRGHLLVQKIRSSLRTGFVVVSCWCRLICQRKLVFPLQESSSSENLTFEVTGTPPLGSLCGFWRASFAWQREVETRPQPQRERKLTAFVFQRWAHLQTLIN